MTVEVICIICGTNLYVEMVERKIRISPCTQCIIVDRQSEYNKGYEDGYKAGYAEEVDNE